MDSYEQLAPDSLRIALWATNLAHPLNGVDAWATLVESRMAEAAERGAELLVMPEYMSEQWLSFAPRPLGPHEEIPWMADQAQPALRAIADLPARYGLGLLAGTMPVQVPQADPDASPYVNRAHLLLPDGRVIAQDKLCLTPFETEADGWNLSPGNRLEIVRWRGIRLTTLICLDVELPALSSLLAPHQVDLILVPSETSRLSGYARVFHCARARAVELQAAVAAVGVIGAASVATGDDGGIREPNTSGASLFLPCEEVLGDTGVAGEIPPVSGTHGPGPMLVSDVPLALLRELRNGRAEVWPGAWSAAHVMLGEA